MSKKEKEEIKEEIKEKTDEVDTIITDDSNADAKPEVKEEIKEEVAQDTKVDVAEEIADVEEPKIEESTQLADPFSSWETIFSEFHKEMPPESPAEAQVWSTRDEIQMIAREEIKGWVKGVQEGKYPMPTGIIQTIDSTLTEVASPFPEKEFKSVQDDILEIKKSKEDATTRLDEIMKSLDAMKKEI
ncbi:MAG: hypothetical protein KAR20_19620, partial [Candidatus Heimdallarchaeota archaeon]|nr:hypothetical protein [Candidatus Heimdallarchaeota archaeon]